MREGAEKHNKDILQIYEHRIATLEGDLARAEKQLDALKKERKYYGVRDELTNLCNEVRNTLSLL